MVLDCPVGAILATVLTPGISDECKDRGHFALHTSSAGLSNLSCAPE